MRKQTLEKSRFSGQLKLCIQGTSTNIPDSDRLASTDALALVACPLETGAPAFHGYCTSADYSSMEDRRRKAACPAQISLPLEWTVS